MKEFSNKKYINVYLGLGSNIGDRAENLRSAARLIERMEDEGMVGAPNHVGRRDVLRDEMGNPR